MEPIFSNFLKYKSLDMATSDLGAGEGSGAAPEARARRFYFDCEFCVRARRFYFDCEFCVRPSPAQMLNIRAHASGDSFRVPLVAAVEMSDLIGNAVDAEKSAGGPVTVTLNIDAELLPLLVRFMELQPLMSERLTAHDDASSRLKSAQQEIIEAVRVRGSFVGAPFPCPRRSPCRCTTTPERLQRNTGEQRIRASTAPSRPVESSA